MMNMQQIFNLKIIDLYVHTTHVTKGRGENTWTRDELVKCSCYYQRRIKRLFSYRFEKFYCNRYVSIRKSDKSNHMTRNNHLFIRFKHLLEIHLEFTT